MDGLTVIGNLAAAYQLLIERDYQRALSIFLELEAEGHGSLSAHIGFIYDHMDPRNPHKARQFYRRAAEEGDPRGMRELGKLLAEQGHFQEAAYWFRHAIKFGETECYFLSYVVLKKMGAVLEANTALNAAASLGNPIAIKDQSLRMIRGRDGVLSVFAGIAQYVRNFPALLRANNKAR